MFPTVLNYEEVVLSERKAILAEALNWERRMTVTQLAKLSPLDKMGNPLAPTLAQESPKQIWIAGSYSHTVQCLRRHEGALFKVYERKYESNIWTLKDAHFRNARGNIDHELGCADIFSVLYPLRPKQFHWDSKWTKDEWHKYNIVEMKVEYDRRLIWNDRLYFWEYDRGTEDILPFRKRTTEEHYRKTINFKIEKYIAFAKSNPRTRFHVLFTIEDCKYGDYRGKDKSLERAEAILLLLAQYGQGLMFTVALHRDIIGDKNWEVGVIHNDVTGDPLGKHFSGYRDSTPLSFTELT